MVRVLAVTIEYGQIQNSLEIPNTIEWPILLYYYAHEQYLVSLFKDGSGVRYILELEVTTTSFF